MRIDIYLSEACGSYHSLRENLERAISELRISPEISYHTVYSYDEAVALNIKGSPSIWIEGKDAFDAGLSPGIL